MAHSWTDKLKSLSISAFKLVEYQHTGEDFVDCSSDAVAMSYFFRDTPDLESRVEALQVVHDYYMGAYCTTYDELTAQKTIPAQALIALLKVELSNDAGDTYFTYAPLQLHSATVYRRKGGNGYGPQLVQAACRGVEFGNSMAAVIGEDMHRTILHESLHLLHDSLSYLDKIMYGDTEGDKREEIMAHIVTDHFEKLENLFNGLKFKVRKESVILSDKSYFDRCEIHLLEDILDSSGKSVLQRVKYDQKAMLKYRQERETLLNLAED